MSQELVSITFGPFVLSETLVPNIFKFSRSDGKDISNEPPSTAVSIFYLIYKDIMDNKFVTSLSFDFTQEDNSLQVMVLEDGDVPAFLTNYRQDMAKC